MDGFVFDLKTIRSALRFVQEEAGGLEKRGIQRVPRVVEEAPVVRLWKAVSCRRSVSLTGSAFARLHRETPGRLNSGNRIEAPFTAVSRKWILSI